MLWYLISCNGNIQVFIGKTLGFLFLRLVTYIQERTPICLNCQVAKMLEGHTLDSILPQLSTTLINTSLLFWRVLIFIGNLKLVALDDGQLMFCYIVLHISARVFIQ